MSSGPYTIHSRNFFQGVRNSGLLFFKLSRIRELKASVSLKVLLFIVIRILIQPAHRRQPWGCWGVATPRFWAGGSWGSSGVAGGLWTSRKILLYLIMYRKYVRKW